MNPTSNNQAGKKPQASASNHTNFIEALKSNVQEIGTGVKQGLVDDLVMGMPGNIMDGFFGGSNPGANSQPGNQDSQPFSFEEFMRSSEAFAAKRQHEQVARTYSNPEITIFNRRNEEVKKKIESIQAELKALAQAVVQLDQTAQTVIEQEVVNPGIYHLNFFDNLIIFIRNLRKRVSESRHWASMNSYRKGHKSYFWKQASSKVGGTKFMLSQERAVQTQTG